MTSETGTEVTGEIEQGREQAPKLRFREFAASPYIDVRLGQVTEEPKPRKHGHVSRAFVMGVRKDDGIVPMEERLIAKDIGRYKIVSTDNFAYNPMRLNIGSIARWRGKEEVLVSPDYVVFRCLANGKTKGLLPAYLDQFRRSAQWDAFVNQSGDGGVRKRVYYADLAELPIRLPALGEQQKIADCLSSLDAMIAAEGARLAALKAHKKGLMQALFPAPGHTTPRLRFPKFQGATEWKAKRLESIGKLVTGLTYSPTDVRETGLLVLRSSNIKDGKIDLSDRVYVDPAVKRANLARPDDILICARNGSISLIGKNAIIPKEMPLATHGAFMTVFRSPAAKFVLQLFQTQAYRQQVAADLGATINSINGTQLLNYRFLMPSEPEQKEIGDFLASLDAVVGGSADRVEALKRHKSALMQQLFPSPAKASE